MKILFGILVIVLIAVAVVLYQRRRKDDEPIVLGRELAKAMVEEEKRLEENSGLSSPLPEATYGRFRGEWGLLNPRRCELDDTLREHCASFAKLAANEREEFRKGVSMDQGYTLLEFARRASVFGLRDDDPTVLRDGLTAIAMIEAKRTDFRDVLMALALLHHSVQRSGIDAGAAFAEASEIAEPRTTELIAKSLLQMAGEKKPKDYSMIGFAWDRLFAVLVARSVWEGTESFETMESLSRFREPINKIMREVSEP